MEELEQQLARDFAHAFYLRHRAEFMLGPVSVVGQWREIERGLPEDWSTAQLLLRVPNVQQLGRAAALLAPLNAGRVPDGISVYCARRGPGAGPEQMARLLERLDTEGVEGELELVTTEEAAPPAAAAPRPALAQKWEAELSALPPDWSDVYGELDLTSSDYLPRAALLVAPLNPSRFDDRPGYRFRCARRFGYGASPGMVRRCLERLDGEGITGDVQILRSLADTQPVWTQGPVWYVNGRSV
jgi:hypothetical protein